VVERREELEEERRKEDFEERREELEEERRKED
jgi:hypothetical protein